MVMVPDVGSMSRLIIRMVVVLPQPDGRRGRRSHRRNGKRNAVDGRITLARIMFGDSVEHDLDTGYRRCRIVAANLGVGQRIPLEW